MSAVRFCPEAPLKKTLRLQGLFALPDKLPMEVFCQTLVLLILLTVLPGQTNLLALNAAIVDMAKGTQDMVKGIDTINKVADQTLASTETMATASEEQTASMHEISRGAESLAEMAGELNRLVQNFKL